MLHEPRGACMTVFTVAVKYLQGRFVASALTAFSVALGVSLIIASFLLTRGIKEGFVEGTTDYNLVVGAKGSPTQLVLSVVFRMDVATPNILTRTFRRLQEDPRVDVAVPLALGDAFQGFRYVATGPAYFAAFPWRRRRSPSRKGGSFTTTLRIGPPTRRCWAPSRHGARACGSATASTRE